MALLNATYWCQPATREGDKRPAPEVSLCFRFDKEGAPLAGRRAPIDSKDSCHDSGRAGLAMWHARPCSTPDNLTDSMAKAMLAETERAGDPAHITETHRNHPPSLTAWPSGAGKSMP